MKYVYQRNVDYISEILILSAKFPIYQRNIDYISDSTIQLISEIELPIQEAHLLKENPEDYT